MSKAGQFILVALIALAWLGGAVFLFARGNACSGVCCLCVGTFFGLLLSEV